jgi:hypothetical protein
MEAQRGARPRLQVSPLQQARRTKTRDRIGYRHCLSPEYPASHREPDCRIAQMHHTHIHPQWIGWYCEGEELLKLYRHNTNGLDIEQGTSVP